MISIEELNYFECLDPILQEKADKLSEAITNWELPILYVEDYIKGITIFLGGSIEINKWQIESVLENRNAVYDMWKMESISVLLDLYENESSSLNLKFILDDLIFKIEKTRV
jgi:hypothetical protein